MRTFCLLLILANALFFIWSQLIDVQVSPLDRAPAASPAPRIVLAREVGAGSARSGLQADESRAADGEQRSGAVASGAEGQQQVLLAARDASSCTSVGPFAELPQAADAQAALASAGYQSRQRMESGELWFGHWVSVQNFATREEAEAAVQTLVQHGVTDVYLMPAEEPGRIVSLGVFSDYQRAQRRAAKVRALGFEPRVQDRKRPGSVYWIDVDLPAPGHALDLSLFQTDLGRITRLEMRACPQTPAG
ncbi:MAG TPA: hypothetical protein VK025_00330 [Steroidobacter sp.]|jgi:hypothetical protein|nr:SPOR domain-containing protein [Steroidobacteraceae bacterium]HLS79837.1 hypothetical protein [Steroidobacter sp.]